MAYFGNRRGERVSGVLKSKTAMSELAFFSKVTFKVYRVGFQTKERLRLSRLVDYDKPLLRLKLLGTYLKRAGVSSSRTRGVGATALSRRDKA
jgi:hypothetical protein